MTVIVVIDDRVTNRRILSRLAESLEEGALVKSFGNPEKALDWAKTNTPDLVVTDFKMPEMDGAEFTRAFRAEPPCYDVPVMVVTVFEDRDFRYKALEAGATDFLLSPIDHREFRVRGRNLLTLRKQQQLIKRRAGELEHRLQTSGVRHEEELRRSREQLLSVLDAVPAMIAATDVDSQYIFVNRAKAAFLGINPDDAVGQTAVDLFGEAIGRTRMELDRWILETGESPPPFEEAVIDRSGGKRVLLTTKRPFNDEQGNRTNVVTVWLDITDRKQAEIALAEQRQFLRAVIDNNPNWIFTSNQDGCITLANQAFAEACGHEVDEVEGQLYSTVGTDRKQMKQISADDQDLFAGTDQSSTSERAFTAASGQEHWMQFARVRFPTNHGETKILTVGTDFTERKEAENALRLAKEQAEAASRSKTEFLANMSHELRTPLNAIIGFSEMIHEGLLGPVGNAKYLEYASNIKDSGNHLLGIINDILEVSKIEAGKLELREQDVVVATAVQDVLRLLNSRIEERQLRTRKKIPEGFPLLRCDERKFKQILLNIISNSVKFTPEGGRIDVACTLDESNGIIVQVSDTGIGMAEEDVPRALERFGQVEHVLTRQHSGTGLGLPLSAGLIDLHGGRLDIESKVDKGTSVSLVFPPDRTIESVGAKRARQSAK